MNLRNDQVDAAHTVLVSAHSGGGSFATLFAETITMFFTGITITFLKQLSFGLWLTLPLLLSLAAGIALLGYRVGKKEGWSRLDTFYWSFVTATTVGYGDLRPVKTASKIAAVLIAFLGLMMTGILVAVAVHAVNLALDIRR